MTLDLGDGVVMQLVKIPSGTFLMGDEGDQRIVTIEKPFWIGSREVTNAQYQRFDSGHSSGYYVKRRDRADGKGLTLDSPEQPVVRVSGQQAIAFCQWLSRRHRRDRSACPPRRAMGIRLPSRQRTSALLRQSRQRLFDRGEYG